MKRLPYLLLLAFVLAGMLPAPAAPYKGYTKLNEVASWLAGKPVKIRCQSAWESANDPLISVFGAAAYVEVVIDPFTRAWIRPKDYSVFSHGLCEKLLEHQAGEKLTPDYVWAMLVLVHESGHLRGAQFPLWYDEGIVNCWALRRLAAVAQLRFGLPPEQVPKLKRLAWRIFLEQPDRYNISSCTLT